MSTINFSNGIKVEFDGVPTEQDVDEVVADLKSKGVWKEDVFAPPALKPETQPQLESPKKSGLATQALGFAKGVGKEIASQGIGLVQGLGSLGTGILAAATPGKTFRELTKERREAVSGTPFGGLVSDTAEAKRQEQALKAKGTAEKVGKITGFVLSLLGGGTTKTAQKTFEAGSKVLEKETLRLTSAAKREIGMKTINEVSDTLSKLKLIGSPQTRYDKIINVENEFESIFQRAISKSKAVINRNALLDELNTLQRSLTTKDPAEMFSIARDIREAKAILARYPDEIPIATLNVLKRSFANRAFAKNFNLLSDTTQLGISSVFRRSVEQAAETTGLKIGGLAVNDFNAAYGKVLTAKGLLKAALGKPEVGVLPRIIAYTTGTAAGYSAGGAIGGAGGAAIASGLAKMVLGTGAKSIASATLKTAAEAGEKVQAALSRFIPR